MKWFLLWRQFVALLRSTFLALGRNTAVNWRAFMNSLLALLNRALDLAGFPKLQNNIEPSQPENTEPEQTPQPEPTPPQEPTKPEPSSPYDGLTQDEPSLTPPASTEELCPRRRLRIFKRRQE